MRKSLLATVAAVALMAGTGFATAEGARESGGGASAGGQAQGQGGMQSQGGSMQGQGGVNAGSRGGEMRGQAQGQGQGQGQVGQGQGQTDRSSPQRAQDQNQRPNQDSQDRSRGQDRQDAQDRSRGQDRQDAQDRSRGEDRDRSAGRDGGRGGSVNLSSEQKTKIRNTVVKSGPKVTNVNFSLSVGTVVPRSVKFVSVPPTLIEIYPQWRGYSYFIVREQVVIIDPDTLRIIAVIDV
jgi:hypothetical protein